jgi:hypothetical protein
MGHMKMTFFNPSDTTNFKKIHMVTGARSETASLLKDETTMSWMNTSAINRIVIKGYTTANLIAGSKITIVGVNSQSVVTDISGNIAGNNSEVLLYDVTLTSASTSSINADYEGLRLTCNNDTTASNYTYSRVYGYNGSFYNETGNNYEIGWVYGDNLNADYYSQHEILIPYYTSSKYKNIQLVSGTTPKTSRLVSIYETAWASASSVTRIAMFPQSGSFMTGSRLQVIGVKASNSAVGLVASGYDYICVQDQKTQGTAGGTFTAGAWQTRDLNTIISGSGFVTVDSNQITLQAGSYIINARCPVYAAGSHKARLYNVSASAVVTSTSGSGLYGTSEYTRTGTGTGGESVIHGQFVLTSTATLRIEHYANTTVSTSGFGDPDNISGAPEIYTVAELWKEKTSFSGISGSANEIAVLSGTGGIVSSGIPLARPYLKFTEETASGVNGGQLDSGVWNFRLFTNEIQDTSSMGSVSSGSIVLSSAGTYDFKVESSANMANGNMLRLREFSSQFTTIVGKTSYARNGEQSTSTPTVCGRFTTTGSAVLILEHYASNTYAYGKGWDISSGLNNIHTVFELWKVS